ncbi:uncharacterized protein LOC112601412 [Melanaphis sacchari]|uniref:uncharacterized protein LOC112601412 n=1 Tax=Melanaphis sacchari TaxID=742174 RepID=UPI000DC15017|nr:uncharacterized protein LOC112601412 [Melanaphis sacchari]
MRSVKPLLLRRYSHNHHESFLKCAFPGAGERESSVSPRGRAPRVQHSRSVEALLASRLDGAYSESRGTRFEPGVQALATALSASKSVGAPLCVPRRLLYSAYGFDLYRQIAVSAGASLVSTSPEPAEYVHVLRPTGGLAPLVRALGGSAQWKRRLLAFVLESQLLYAAPVWIPAVVEVARIWAILIRPQRTAALRVIRSYRTVSDEAALIMACMPPVDLLGLERQSIGSRLRAAMEPGEQRPPKAVVKHEARKNTFVVWQARWRATLKAAWTRRVIPDLSRWLERTVPWVPLTFHMTQALTGHGCFGWYLHRMNRAVSPRCWQCSGESDTGEYTLFDCPHWDGFREPLSARIGHRPSIDDVPDIILPVDAHGWDAILSEAEEQFRLFYGMVENILSAKEEEERCNRL